MSLLLCYSCSASDVPFSAFSRIDCDSLLRVQTEHPPCVCPTSTIFFISKGRIAAKVNPNGLSFPMQSEWSGSTAEACLYIGSIDSSHFFISAANQAPDGYSFLPIRSLIPNCTAVQYKMMSRAYSLMHWHTGMRFCSNCGHSLVFVSADYSKFCPVCYNAYYPRITPAVIVLIYKDDSILLAHNKQFESGFFSLIAGFVEAGETLEEAVYREVWEETGLKIHQLSYIRSQAWPFPDSLMVGYSAHYLSGTIEPDGKEITEAAWFTRDSMPKIPRPGSISRYLIDQYLQGNSM